MKTSKSHARGKARFWSAVGLFQGILLLALLVFFLVILFWVSPPPPPEKPILNREAVLKALALPLQTPKERYTNLASVARALVQKLPSKELALKKDLEEVILFADLLSAPASYLLHPEWIEIPQENIEIISAFLPTMLIETREDTFWTGIEFSPSAIHNNRLNLPSTQKIEIQWKAGDPLRLRFRAKGTIFQFDTYDTLGGEDIEQAPDLPLPDAAILLLGEPREFTRGKGRYLVRVQLLSSPKIPLSVPPLLIEATNYL